MTPPVGMPLQEYGMFGVMATLIVQLVRSEMTNRKNPVRDFTASMREHFRKEDRDHVTLLGHTADLCDKTRDMHSLTTAKDSEGIPLVYVSRKDQRDLRDAINVLSKGIGELTVEIRKNGNSRAK